jgi:hypothetical protein
VGARANNDRREVQVLEACHAAHVRLELLQPGLGGGSASSVERVQPDLERTSVEGFIDGPGCATDVLRV